MGMPGLMMPPFMNAAAGGAGQGSTDQQFNAGMLNPFMMGAAAGAPGGAVNFGAAGMPGFANFAQQNQGNNKSHGDDQ